MGQIELSVIIPCYNNSKNLQWILEAIKASPVQKLEILCIDDASTENIEKIANFYEVRYQRLPGKTPGRRALARNVGHKLSKGKISFYLDGDVVPEPRIFGNAINLHAENPKVAVKYPVYSLPEDRHRKSMDVLAALIIEHKLAELGPSVTKHVGIDTRPLPRRLRGKKTNLWVLCASHCTSIERLEVENIGGWDESFHGWGEEDLELAYRLFKAGNKFIYPHRKYGAAYHLDHASNWGDRLMNLLGNLLYFRSKHPESWIGRKSLLRMFLEENDLPKIIDDLN